MHVAGVRADARTFEHIDPERRRQPPRAAGLGAVRQGHRARPRRGGGHRAGLRRPPCARSTALKELEHRGYHFEAADASFELLLRKEAGVYEPLFRLESFRVITEKREDGRVQTEATIKIWAEGERIVRTAEGNGPVNALDRALRDAIADLYPRLRDIDLVNYKVRIIDEHKGTGAVTRVLIDASDGRDTLGHDRRLGEHHRGELGGAGRLARVRDAVEARRPGTARRAARSVSGRSAATGTAATATIPLARPDIGPREEELVLEVLRSGRLSLGPMLERFEREFASLAGRRTTRSRCRAGRRRCTSAVRALGWGRGDEVVTSPLSFVASANCLLYEGAKPGLLRHRPRDPQHRPAGRGGGHAAERTVGLLPVHLFGYPADMAALERLAERHGLGIVEDACEAFGAVDAEGVRVGARGHPPTFAFYANKQLVTGEGGMLTTGDPGLAERARSERNQGRGEDMARIVHDRLGFNYRLSDVAAAIGVAQLERADADPCSPRAGGGPLPRAPGWHRGPGAAGREPGAAAAQLVRLRRSAAGAASTATP